MEDHRDTGIRDLPTGFRPGKAATDHVNGLNAAHLDLSPAGAR
jgi:hypothetical protein